MDVRKVVEGAASGKFATAIFDRPARLACQEDVLFGSSEIREPNGN